MMIVITALVQVASEVVCDISAFHSAMPKRKGGNDESGGGQHSAGKRVVLTRNSKAESSGGSHSADSAMPANDESGGGQHSAGKREVVQKIFIPECPTCMKYLSEHYHADEAALELMQHCRNNHYDTYTEYKRKRSDVVADFVKILYRPPEIQGDRRCYWVSCPEKCGKKLGTRIGFHHQDLHGRYLSIHFAEIGSS